MSLDARQKPDVAAPLPVRSLSRGLAILGQFSADHTVLSLAEISQGTGLHKATAYRLVKTLEAEGYLTSLGSGRYGIGPVWAMALYRVGSAGVFGEILHVDLRALAQSTLETVTLGVRAGDAVQVVHVLPPSRSFLPVLPKSQIHPLHATWNVHAQILLAFSDEDTRVRMSAVPQTRHTDHTVIDPQAALARLAQVRRESVAYDREEYNVGTCAVGVPVISGGKVAAALALVVPVERFSQETVTSLVEQLHRAASGMSRRLGSSAGKQPAEAWPGTAQE